MPASCWIFQPLTFVRREHILYFPSFFISSSELSKLGLSYAAPKTSHTFFVHVLRISHPSFASVCSPSSLLCNSVDPHSSMQRHQACPLFCLPLLTLLTATQSALWLFTQCPCRLHAQPSLHYPLDILTDHLTLQFLGTHVSSCIGWVLVTSQHFLISEYALFLFGSAFWYTVVLQVLVLLNCYP